MAGSDRNCDLKVISSTPIFVVVVRVGEHNSSPVWPQPFFFHIPRLWFSNFPTMGASDASCNAATGKSWFRNVLLISFRQYKKVLLHSITLEGSLATYLLSNYRTWRLAVAFQLKREPESPQWRIFTRVFGRLKQTALILLRYPNLKLRNIVNGELIFFHHESYREQFESYRLELADRSICMRRRGFDTMSLV